MSKSLIINNLRKKKTPTWSITLQVGDMAFLAKHPDCVAGCHDLYRSIRTDNVQSFDVAKDTSSCVESDRSDLGVSDTEYKDGSEHIEFVDFRITDRDVCCSLNRQMADTTELQFTLSVDNEIVDKHQRSLAILFISCVDIQHRCRTGFQRTDRRAVSEVEIVSLVVDRKVVSFDRDMSEHNLFVVTVVHVCIVVREFQLFLAASVKPYHSGAPLADVCFLYVRHLSVDPDIVDSAVDIDYLGINSVSQSQYSSVLDEIRLAFVSFRCELNRFSFGYDDRRRLLNFRCSSGRFLCSSGMMR